jgi:hypothetical protein
LGKVSFDILASQYFGRMIFWQNSSLEKMIVWQNDILGYTPPFSKNDTAFKAKQFANRLNK